VTNICQTQVRGLPAGRIDLRDERNQTAIAVLRVGMSEFELPPLGEPVGLPPPLVPGEREDVRPAERLLAPANRLRHGFPHGDHNGGENEVLRRTQKITPGTGPRVSVAQSDESRGSGAGDMGFGVAAEDLFNRLTRAHRDSANVDGLSARGFVTTSVKNLRDLFDPLLFFRTIGENEFQRTGRWSLFLH